MACCKRKSLLGRSSCLVLVTFIFFFLLYLLREHTHGPLSYVDNLSNNNLGKPQGHGKDVRFVEEAVPRHAPVPSHGSSSRFVLGLNYWEQLSMATRNMYQLVCLADTWNASVVRPFTLSSRLYGLRHLKADEQVDDPQPAYDLNVIFDTDKLNSHLVKHKLPSLTDFQKFLKVAPRQLYVIHYIPINEVHELKVMTLKNGTLIRSALKKNNVADCSKYLEGYKARLTKTLNSELLAASLEGPKFTIVKYVCVNMSVLTRPRKLGSKVGLPLDGGMSVIVVNWRGTSRNAVITNSAKGVHLNKRVVMSGMCRKTNVSTLASEILPHSTVVLKAIVDFTSSIGLMPGQDYIAVHLRSEKIGLREERYPNALESCVKELMAVREKLAKDHPGMTMIDMTDVGPYGSGTCQSCKSARTVSSLYESLGVKAVHFDPSLFSGVPDDRGFASAVDVELLSSSSYLVLCGGGAFQNQAALRFLKNGRGKDRIIEVCTTDIAVGEAVQSHKSDEIII